MMRRLGIVVGGGAGIAAFYLLLIDTAYLPEIDAGIAVTLIASAAYVAALREDAGLLAGARQWVRGTLRAFARVPGDLAQLTVAALTIPIRDRGSRCGEFVTREVAGDLAADRARREVLGSLSPGEIVLGHDVDGRLIVHRFTRWT